MATPISIPKNLRGKKTEYSGGLYFHSKRQKVCDRRETGIGDLPEEIFDDILSFLPTKHALATKLLSKSWNLHGTKLTALDFDESTWKVSGNSFVEFVDKVLLSHSAQSIHKFSLTARYASMNHLNRCIDVVIRRNIRVLNLCLITYSDDQKVDLPPSFYSCETLEVVILKGRFVLSEQVSYLPKLKVLELSEVIHKSDESRFRILGPRPGPTSVKLHAKSVENNVAELLESCDGDLKVLELNWSGVRALSAGNYRSSTITTLVIHIKASQWRHLMNLVHNCSNLQVLDLTKKASKKKEEEEEEDLPEVSGRCSSSLRSVSFKGYLGLNDEMEMVYFIMQHAVVIETLTLCSTSFTAKKAIRVYQITVNSHLLEIQVISGCLLEFLCKDIEYLISRIGSSSLSR